MHVPKLKQKIVFSTKAEIYVEYRSRLVGFYLFIFLSEILFKSFQLALVKSTDSLRTLNWRAQKCFQAPRLGRKLYLHFKSVLE